MTGAAWRKSSYSDGGSGQNCVEVRSLPSLVAVRDSKDPHSPALAVASEDWRAFTDRVKAGAFGLG